MRTIFSVLLGLSAALGLARAAQADGLTYASGPLNARVYLEGSVQGGDSGSKLTPHADRPNALRGLARLTADWTTNDGRLFGVNIEVSSERRQTEALNTGEIYAYLASDFGRLEIGRQDGAADQLALRAPVIALGQIRGDFSRYAGSPALLSAFDTEDAPKIIYLSPPVAGLRVGASWAPRDEHSADAFGPRTLQRNGYELGAQYERPVGGWVVGLSGGYVHADSEVTTGRADIRSWSVGAQARKGPLRIGGGYVDRGDSNLTIRGFNQREWSGGVAWVQDRWGVGASASTSTASTFHNTLAGAGGYYSITDWVTLRADVVYVDQRFGSATAERAVVGVAELAVHY